MKMLTIKIPVPNRTFWVATVSILLSVFMVAVVTYGASTIDTASVGAGTSTPGTAIAAKGDALIEGMVHGAYFLSTSTDHATGFGSTSPGTEFDVNGGGLFAGGLITSYINATSTVNNVFGGAIEVTEAATSTFTDGVDVGTSGLEVTAGGLRVNAGQAVFDETIEVSGAAATSTFTGGVTVDGTTLVADYSAGKIGIGTTTPNSATVSVGAGTATTTLYLAGGPTVGAEIIMKSADGEGCISIIADRNGNDLDAVAMTASTLLSVQVVACPTDGD